MRKVVNVNGRNIYVYRKGHENKHLGRAFVKYWKEGKVALPPNGKHRLQEDRHGKKRVFANSALDRRKLPHKKLGLQRSIHRKNYVEIRNTLKELLPHIFETQSILQHVTITVGACQSIRRYPHTTCMQWRRISSRREILCRRLP